MTIFLFCKTFNSVYTIIKEQGKGLEYMRTFRDIEVLKTLQVTKNDFKDLETFLITNDLLDNQKLWFAGFENYRKATNNAVAENLFYGNKRLKVVSIKNKDVFYISNSKEGLKVRLLGNTEEKFKMSSLKILLYPTVNITTQEGLLLELKVTKNKGCIKEFKKAIRK